MGIFNKICSQKTLPLLSRETFSLTPAWDLPPNMMLLLLEEDPEVTLLLSRLANVVLRPFALRREDLSVVLV